MLPEFDEVVMPTDDLEQLRQMLVSGSVKPLSFYPATLVQISTLGLVHNLSPLAQTKTNPAVGNQEERQIPIFRFYFDGLIIHMHRHPVDSGYTAKLGPLIAGAHETLHVTMVTYEGSFQRENLCQVLADTLAAPAQANPPTT